MKKIYILILILCCWAECSMGQTAKKELTILLSGASFASPDNGWFEQGCETLHAIGINRAIGGEAIADAANKMSKGELYSPKELDDIDIFVIMHVHNKDVYEERQLKVDYRDYSLPFTRENYAAAFDYVIKRYLSDCYRLQFEKTSKYYGVKGGKPSVIILCTHWHDARTVYNRTVRTLANKWGFPLIKFDEKIGFTHSVVHPETHQPFSILYADDTEKIGETVHGWHPKRGKDQFVQQRMAAIFVDMIRSLTP